jgi:type III secretory pathway component EscS
MTPLDLWVTQALGLVVGLVLPIVVAAALGSLVATALGSFSGLQDTTVSAVSRGLAVLLAIGMLAGSIGNETKQFVSASWSELPAVGRGP